jgi:hypothetical protein
MGGGGISNPRAIAELLNSYFVEIVGKLTHQNSGTHATYTMTNLKINTCPQTISNQSCIRKRSRKGDKES